MPLPLLFDGNQRGRRKKRILINHVKAEVKTKGQGVYEKKRKTKGQVIKYELNSGYGGLPRVDIPPDCIVKGQKVEKVA